MNRRNFLSLIGATALTPVIPAQIFAAGGIVNPEHCGYWVGEGGAELHIATSNYGGPYQVSARLTVHDGWRSAGIFMDSTRVLIEGDAIYHKFLHGDGTGQKTGLI